MNANLNSSKPPDQNQDLNFDAETAATLDPREELIAQLVRAVRSGHFDLARFALETLAQQHEEGEAR